MDCTGYRRHRACDSDNTGCIGQQSRNIPPKLASCAFCSFHYDIRDAERPDLERAELRPLPAHHRKSFNLYTFINARYYFTQSSSTRPGTCSNPLVLFVTSTAPAAMACPAIIVSFGPIGVPAVRRATLMSLVVSTAARQNAGRSPQRYF